MEGKEKGRETKRKEIERRERESEIVVQLLVSSRRRSDVTCALHHMYDGDDIAIDQFNSSVGD